MSHCKILIYTLYSLDSPYQNREFENDVFPLQPGNNLDAQEYVQMIGDVLRMNKNICLCRNFVSLTKERNKWVYVLYITILH